MDILPISIRTFGHIKKNPDHWSLATKQKDYMLNIYIHGFGYYQEGGSVEKIYPNTIGLFLPDDQGMIYSDHDLPYDHYYCRFNGNLAAELCQRIHERYHERFFKYTAIDEVEQICKKMKPVIRNQFLPELTVDEGYLLTILLMLLKAENKLNFKEELYGYLHQNSNRNLPLEEIAQKFRISVRQINRICRKEFQTTVGKLHESIRFSQAKDLLLASQLKIIEIARRVGFEDENYFSKAFKKAEGISPAKYRKEKKLTN